MRQAGVSGVTSRGPNVWKSPNQNDPTVGPDTGLSVQAPSITQQWGQRDQAPWMTVSPQTDAL